MNTFITAVRQFARDERGVTAIEYGLIAALMAAAVAAAVGGMGTAISGKFTKIADSITNA